MSDLKICGPGYRSRYSDSLRAGTVRGSNPGGGEIFRTHPHRPWGPRSLLYNGYRVSFEGVKWPGRGVDHPPPSSAEIKERVELYVYSPSGPSWPVLVWTLPLTFYHCFFLKIVLRGLRKGRKKYWLKERDCPYVPKDPLGQKGDLNLSVGHS